MLPNPSSPLTQQLTFDPQPTQPGKLVFQISIPGRMPSWNDILGMEQWARYQFKRELADLFLSVLRASALDSSMKTISARSTISTCADTLESYLRMRQEKRELKRLSAKPSRAKKSTRKSKSSSYKAPKGKVPF